MYGFCYSLLSPWWVIKETRRDNLDAIVAWAWRTLWLEIVEPLREDRGWSHTYLANRAGWSYDKWNNIKKGKTYDKEGPPVLALYRLAGQLGVEIGEFLPSCRDVHTLATRKLIRDADPEYDVSGAAVEAYVEYHSQNPSKDFGTVDLSAVERAFEAFRSEFDSVEETEAAIVRTAEIIDSIILTTGGGS